MNQKPKNRITYWLKIAVIGIALGLGLQFVRAWTEPTVAPPGGNVGAPINTSGLAQIKAGFLQVTGLSTWAINIPGVVPAAGNVLTAQNASGQLAWAPGGGGTLVGIISAFGGDTAPAGYLLCRGQSVAVADYGALFAVLQYKYGGSGSNFILPDLQQKFPMGKAASGTGAALGGTGGTLDASISAPAHKHDLEAVEVTDTSGLFKTLYSMIGYDSSFPEAYPVRYMNWPGGMRYPEGVHGTASAGGGASIVYNPPFQTVNYIIKY